MFWKELEELNQELAPVFDRYAKAERDRQAKEITDLLDEIRRVEENMPPLIGEDGTRVLTREEYDKEILSLREQMIRETERGITEMLKEE